MFIRLTDTETKKPMLVRPEIILRVEEVENTNYTENENGEETETTTIGCVLHLQDQIEVAVDEPLAAIDQMLQAESY